MSPKSKRLLSIIIVGFFLILWMSFAWSFWAFYLPYLKIKARFNNANRTRIFRHNGSELHIQNAVSYQDLPRRKNEG